METTSKPGRKKSRQSKEKRRAAAPKKPVTGRQPAGAPQLASNEETHWAISQHIEDGYYELDLAGNFTFFNDSLCRIIGYSSDELPGMNYRQYIDAEAAKQVYQTFNHVYQTGQLSKGLHYQVIRKDGTKRFVDVSIHLMQDSSGQPVGFWGIIRDITERKRVEEALRRSEAEFRSLFEHAPYGIYRSSLDGKFLAVNPALVEMLGYDSGEELMAVNMATDIYQDPGERARVVKQYKDVQSFKGLEAQWKRKSGRPILVRWSGRPVRDESNEIFYFEAMVEDITEQRSLEDQLRQSQKMEAVGQLAGGIAHDFNNLLMLILGYSELLLNSLEADHPGRRNADEIRKAANRATALTHQLLAFSRKQILQPKILDLNAIVADIEKMLRRIIGEDIDLITLLDPKLGSVKAAPGQIEQVILNLAVNARDAMPQGGQLAIETANDELREPRAQQSPGSYVLLTVSDTGEGMDAETQVHIFEPFFTTKEKGKGTGLGLATVYGIVKQSGGHIWVESEIGQGTTFSIYLPRVAPEPDSIASVQDSQPAHQSSETVLLVEDETVLRKLANEFLTMNGYQVLPARNGEDALRVATEHSGPIQALVTDVVMPGMNGRELANQLGSLRPEMKTLYISGYTDDAVIYQGNKKPGTTFLQKPFALGALARKLRALLDS